MLSAWLALRAEEGEMTAVVTVTGVQGSAPREVGATMGVCTRETCGTIGGGALEERAIREARDLLTSGETSAEFDQPLGPEIGQCCGGRVQLSLTRANLALIADLQKTEAAQRAEHPSVLIFGAGHTGGALARALVPLPLSITVIDQRADWLAQLSPAVNTRETVLPEAEIAAAPVGSAFVILTHDHALDFLIAEAALSRGDAAYVGMIGSATKRAKLSSDLARKGISTKSLICPIGGKGSTDKRPEVIAAATAAEIVTALL